MVSGPSGIACSVQAVVAGCAGRRDHGAGITPVMLDAAVAGVGSRRGISCMITGNGVLGGLIHEYERVA